MGKRRQPKSGSKAKRKRPTKKRDADEPIRADGVMSGMVGGFRRAVGVEKTNKRAPWSLLWTALLVIAVVTILAYNLSQ